MSAAVFLVSASGFAAVATTLCGIALGSLLTYVGIAGLVGHTTIDASPAAIVVRHGPLPMFAGARVASGAIYQLYTTERPLGARVGPLTRLWAALSDGAHVPLTGLIVNDRDGVVRYVEKLIERHLGIVDRPIHCLRCGYDVRAARRRCPECGLRFQTTKRQRSANAIDQTRRSRDR